MRRSRKKLTSLITLICFLLTQGVFPREAVGEIFNLSVSEVQIPNSGFQINLPPDLGTIQNVASGPGPTVVHIQTAHGNYEAQKKIQAILHYLKKNYGIKLLLLEGSAFKLRPEILRFFPREMGITMEIAEELARKALVKGPELFLLEDREAQALGIENLEAYRANAEAFKAVLTEQDKTQSFVQEMDLQIDRLTAPFLSPHLKTLLKRVEAFEEDHIPFLDWLSILREEAKEVLSLDLTDPANQIDWPMMFRIFKLDEFESKLDLSAFHQEREHFLKAINRVPKEIYDEVKKLLSAPLSHHELPDPQTGLLFERMASYLSEGFDGRAYPNVQRFIGHLILQSELKAERLSKEMEALTEKVLEHWAKTDEEKKILTLLKDHRLLKKLFALELTPENYQILLDSSSRLAPSQVAHRFLELNQSKRVRDIEFVHLDSLDSLFRKALEFYGGVKERDRWLLENIVARMKESGEERAVVVTGGFHSGPFQEFFHNEGYNYALISPRITTTDGREAYVESILQRGTLESAFLSLLADEIDLHGFSSLWSVPRIIHVMNEVHIRRGRLVRDMKQLEARVNETEWAQQYKGFELRIGTRTSKKGKKSLWIRIAPRNNPRVKILIPLREIVEVIRRSRLGFDVAQTRIQELAPEDATEALVQRSEVRTKPEPDELKSLFKEWKKELKKLERRAKRSARSEIRTDVLILRNEERDPTVKAFLSGLAPLLEMARVRPAMQARVNQAVPGRDPAEWIESWTEDTTEKIARALLGLPHDNISKLFGKIFQSFAPPDDRLAEKMNEVRPRIAEGYRRAWEGDLFRPEEIEKLISGIRGAIPEAEGLVGDLLAVLQRPWDAGAVGFVLERLNLQTARKGYVLVADNLLPEEMFLVTEEGLTVREVAAAIPQEFRDIPFSAWILNGNNFSATSPYGTVVSPRQAYEEARKIYEGLRASVEDLKKTKTGEAKLQDLLIETALRSERPELALYFSEWAGILTDLAPEKAIQQMAWDILETILAEEVVHRFHTVARGVRERIEGIDREDDREKLWAKIGAMSLISAPLLVAASNLSNVVSKLAQSQAVHSGDLGRLTSVLEVARALDSKKAEALLAEIKEKEKESARLMEEIQGAGKLLMQMAPTVMPFFLRLQQEDLAEIVRLLIGKRADLQTKAQMKYEALSGLRIRESSLAALQDQFRSLKESGLYFTDNGLELSPRAEVRSVDNKKHVMNRRWFLKRLAFLGTTATALLVPGDDRQILHPLATPFVTPSHLNSYYERLKQLSTGSWDHAGIPFLATTDWGLSQYFSEIKGRGNAMLGIGFQQNFSVALHGQPSTYIILDINPVVTEVMVPLFGYLMEIAQTRREFLSLLSGFPLTNGDVVELLEMPHHEPWILPVNHVQHVLNRLIQRTPFEERRRRFRQLQVIMEEKIFPHLPRGFNRQEIIRTSEAFFGPTRNQEENTGYFTEFLAEHAEAAWVAQNLHERIRLGTWLSSEENYQRTRSYWMEGRFVGVTGDVKGPSVSNAAQWLRAIRRERVSVLYPGNVDQWIFHPSGTQAVNAMYDRLSELPLVEDAKVIISKGYPVTRQRIGIRSFERMRWLYRYLSTSDRLVWNYFMERAFLSDKPPLNRLRDILGEFFRSRGFDLDRREENEREHQVYLRLIREIGKQSDQIRNLSPEQFREWVNKRIPQLDTTTAYFRAVVIILVDSAFIQPSQQERTFRSPPSPRAEVRQEERGGKSNRASVRAFSYRIGQLRGEQPSPRRLIQGYKWSSGVFQESRSFFSPFDGTSQPPKNSTNKEAPASTSFIPRLASFTKKSVEMAAGARSENRLRKAFPNSEQRLIPRRSFIDDAYFDKYIIFNSNYVNNYFPDISTLDFSYVSSRAEVRPPLKRWRTPEVARQSLWRAEVRSIEETQKYTTSLQENYKKLQEILNREHRDRIQNGDESLTTYLNIANRAVRILTSLATVISLLKEKRYDAIAESKRFQTIAFVLAHYDKEAPPSLPEDEDPGIVHLLILDVGTIGNLSSTKKTSTALEKPFLSSEDQKLLDALSDLIDENSWQLQNAMDAFAHPLKNSPEWKAFEETVLKPVEERLPSKEEVWFGIRQELEEIEKVKPLLEALSQTNDVKIVERLVTEFNKDIYATQESYTKASVMLNIIDAMIESNVLIAVVSGDSLDQLIKSMVDDIEEPYPKETTHLIWEAALEKKTEKPRAEVRASGRKSSEELFTEDEIQTVYYRGGLLKQFYGQFSEEAKKVLLHPNILLVFMGIKPAYARYHSKEEPDHRILIPEFQKIPEIWNNLGFQFSPVFFYSPLLLATRFLEEGQFLKDSGVLGPKDEAALQEIEQAFKDQNVPLRYQKTFQLVEDLVARHGYESPQGIALTGFLMGYPIEDIQTMLKGLGEIEKGNKPEGLPVETEYPGVAVVSRLEEKTKRYLTRLTDTLGYAYGLLLDEPGFKELAQELKLPAPFGSRAEVRAIDVGDLAMGLGIGAAIALVTGLSLYFWLRSRRTGPRRIPSKPDEARSQESAFHRLTRLFQELESFEVTMDILSSSPDVFKITDKKEDFDLDESIGQVWKSMRRKEEEIGSLLKLTDPEIQDMARLMFQTKNLASLMRIYAQTAYREDRDPKEAHDYFLEGMEFLNWRDKIKIQPQELEALGKLTGREWADGLIRLTEGRADRLRDQILARIRESHGGTSRAEVRAGEIFINELKIELPESLKTKLKIEKLLEIIRLNASAISLVYIFTGTKSEVIIPDATFQQMFVDLKKSSIIFVSKTLINTRFVRLSNQMLRAIETILNTYPGGMKEAAEKIGISPSYLSNIRTGRAEFISLDIARALEREFKIDLGTSSPDHLTTDPRRIRNSTARKQERQQRRAAFGQFIRELRMAKGLKANVLAGKVGISSAHITMIEKGSRSPGPAVLSALSKELGFDLDEAINRFYTPSTQMPRAEVRTKRPYNILFTEAAENWSEGVKDGLRQDLRSIIQSAQNRGDIGPQDSITIMIRENKQKDFPAEFIHTMWTMVKLNGRDIVAMIIDLDPRILALFNEDFLRKVITAGRKKIDRFDLRMNLKEKVLDLLPYVVRAEVRADKEKLNPKQKELKRNLANLSTLEQIEPVRELLLQAITHIEKNDWQAAGKNIQRTIDVLRARLSGTAQTISQTIEQYGLILRLQKIETIIPLEPITRNSQVRIGMAVYDPQNGFGEIIKIEPTRGKKNPLRTKKPLITVSFVNYWTPTEGRFRSATINGELDPLYLASQADLNQAKEVIEKRKHAYEQFREKLGLVRSATQTESDEWQIVKNFSRRQLSDLEIDYLRLIGVGVDPAEAEKKILDSLPRAEVRTIHLNETIRKILDAKIYDESKKRFVPVLPVQLARKLRRITDMGKFRDFMAAHNKPYPFEERLRREFLKVDAVKRLTADPVQIVFLPVDDVIGWSFRNPKLMEHFGNPSEIIKSLPGGTLLTILGFQNKLKLILIRNNLPPVEAAAFVAHELAHTEHTPAASALYSTSALARSIIEGLQPEREIDLLQSLLASPLVSEDFKKEFQTLLDQALGHPIVARVWDGGLRKFVRLKVDITETLIRGTYLLERAYGSLLAYPQDEAFVEILKSYKVLPDALVSIYRDGNFTPLENSLGHLRFTGLEVLFDKIGFFIKFVKTGYPGVAVPEIVNRLARTAELIRNRLAELAILKVNSLEYDISRNSRLGEYLDQILPLLISLDKADAEVFYKAEKIIVEKGLVYITQPAMALENTVSDIKSQLERLKPLKLARAEVRARRPEARRGKKERKINEREVSQDAISAGEFKGMAGRSEVRDKDLRGHERVPQRRAVRFDGPDETGSSVHSLKHSRGQRPGTPKGIPPVSLRGQRFSLGIDDFDPRRKESQTPVERRSPRTVRRGLERDHGDAPGPHQDPPVSLSSFFLRASFFKPPYRRAEVRNAKQIIQKFLQKYPAHPKDAERALLGMARSLGSARNLKYVLKEFDELLMRKILLREDIPLMARLSTNRYSQEDALADVEKMLTSHYVKGRLQRPYLKRENLYSFLWPLVKIQKDPSMAVMGIGQLLEAGLSKENIHNMLEPIVRLGYTEAAGFFSTLGFLFEGQKITTQDVKQLFLPLLKINSAFLDVGEDAIAGLLESPDIGRERFIEFLLPFIKIAEDSRLDLDPLLDEIIELLNTENWAPEDIHTYILPLAQAGMGQIWFVIRSLRKGIDQGILQKEDLLKFVLPIVRAFGNHTVTVLTNYGKSYVFEETPEELRDIVDFEVKNYFVSPEFLSFVDRFRNIPVDIKVVNRELVAPLVQATIEEIEQELQQTGKEITTSEWREKWVRLRDSLLGASPRVLNLVSELFSGGLKKKRKIEVIRQLGLAKADVARRAVEAESKVTKDPEIKAALERALKNYPPRSEVRANHLEFLDTALISLIDYLDLISLDQKILGTGVVSEIAPYLKLPLRRLTNLYEQSEKSKKPIGIVRGEQSYARSFELYVRKREEIDLISPLVFAIPDTDFAIGVKVKDRGKRPEILGDDNPQITEQIRFFTIMNRLTAEGRKDEFNKYFGGLDVKYYDVIREVREKYKNQHGQGKNDQLFVIKYDAEEHKKAKEKGRELRDVLFSEFEKLLGEVLSTKSGIERDALTVIQELRKAVDHFADLNDLAVELLIDAMRRGRISRENSKIILFLQQTAVGLVNEEIARDIKGRTQYVNLGGYEYGFQFNPSRAKRGGMFSQKTIGRSPETVLSRPYVDDYYPLQRYLPYEEPGGIVYREQANPFPTHFASMNAVHDRIAPQVVALEDLESRLNNLRESTPPGEVTRFRDFFNAPFSGFSIPHLHYQEFLKETNLEKALAMEGAVVLLATDENGVTYSKVNDEFFEKRGKFPLRSTLVIEGRGALATAEAVIRVLQYANMDGSLELTPNSRFTYNLLLVDTGVSFRVYIFIKNLIRDPFNPKSLQEPELIVFTNEPELRDEAERLRKELDTEKLKDKYDQLVASGFEKGLILFSGRPAGVEMTDMLIFGHPRHEAAYNKIVNSLDSQRYVIEKIFNDIYYKGFNELVGYVRTLDRGQAEVRAEARSASLRFAGASKASPKSEGQRRAEVRTGERWEEEISADGGGLDSFEFQSRRGRIESLRVKPEVPESGSLQSLLSRFLGGRSKVISTSNTVNMTPAPSPTKGLYLINKLLARARRKVSFQVSSSMLPTASLRSFVNRFLIAGVPSATDSVARHYKLFNLYIRIKNNPQLGLPRGQSRRAEVRERGSLKPEAGRQIGERSFRQASGVEPPASLRRAEVRSELGQDSEEIARAEDTNAPKRVEDQEVRVARHNALDFPSERAFKDRVIFGIPTDLDGMRNLDDRGGFSQGGQELTASFHTQQPGPLGTAQDVGKFFKQGFRDDKLKLAGDERLKDRTSASSLQKSTQENISVDDREHRTPGVQARPPSGPHGRDGDPSGQTGQFSQSVLETSEAKSPAPSGVRDEFLRLAGAVPTTALPALPKGLRRFSAWTKPTLKPSIRQGLIGRAEARRTTLSSVLRAEVRVAQQGESGESEIVRKAVQGWLQKNLQIQSLDKTVLDQVIANPDNLVSLLTSALGKKRVRKLAKRIPQLIPGLKETIQKARDQAKTVVRVERPAEISPLITNYAPKDLIELKKKMIAAAREITIRHQEPDITDVYALARRINPKFTSKVEGELRAAKLETFGQFLSEVTQEVFLRTGHFLTIVLQEDIEPGVSYGKIREETWKKRPHLDTFIWTVETEFSEAPVEFVGFTFGRFAMVHPERARADALPMFAVIMHPAQSLPPVYRQPRIEHVLEILKLQLLQSGINTPSLYGEHLGLTRNFHQQVRFAEDRTFTQEWLRATQKIGPEEFHGMDEDQKITEAVLKDIADSRTLRRYLENPAYQGEGTRSALFHGIRYLAAEVGGLISEMEFHLRGGRDDFAYAAFLDYLAMKMMEQEQYEFLRSRSQTTTTLDLAIYLRASWFTSGMADFGNQIPGVQITSVSGVIANIEFGMESQGQRALDLVKRIYAADFWTDEERMRRLQEARTRSEMRSDYIITSVGASGDFKERYLDFEYADPQGKEWNGLLSFSSGWTLLVYPKGYPKEKGAERVIFDYLEKAIPDPALEILKALIAYPAVRQEMKLRPDAWDSFLAILPEELGHQVEETIIKELSYEERQRYLQSIVEGILAELPHRIKEEILKEGVQWPGFEELHAGHNIFWLFQKVKGAFDPTPQEKEFILNEIKKAIAQGRAEVRAVKSLGEERERINGEYVSVAGLTNQGKRALRSEIVESKSLRKPSASRPSSPLSEPSFLSINENNRYVRTYSNHIAQQKGRQVKPGIEYKRSQRYRQQTKHRFSGILTLPAGKSEHGKNGILNMHKSQYIKNPRASARWTTQATPSVGEQVEKIVTRGVKATFEGPRDQTLPLRFEEYGTDVLVAALAELLGKTVYSERAGVLPPVLESVLVSKLGEGRKVTAPGFGEWMRATASEAGRVLIDADWFEHLITESPWGIRILLKALKEFQGEEIQEPLIAVVGKADGSAEEIYKRIREALQQENNDLTPVEKFEALEFFNDHYELLKKLVKVVLPEEVQSYVEENDYGVATLVSSQKSFSQFPLGAQFFIDPKAVHKQDTIAVAFVIPALLKAAQLVRSINDPGRQWEKLVQSLKELDIPGLNPARGAHGFVIELAEYIQRVVINEHLLETSA